MQLGEQYVINVPSLLGIKVKTKLKAVDQVRIVPRTDYYVVEAVYDQHYMHTASKRIIDHLVQEEIGTLVIGKTPEWKQEVELGKRTNQNFVQIPHARFIGLLSYKAQLVGIRVLITEESYTSKASFLDHDPIPDYDPNREEKPKLSGKRMARGMYRASDGRLHD